MDFLQFDEHCTEAAERVAMLERTRPSSERYLVEAYVRPVEKWARPKLRPLLYGALDVRDVKPDVVGFASTQEGLRAVNGHASHECAGRLALRCATGEPVSPLLSTRRATD